MPAERPGGSIARGSIFAIFGRDLGPVVQAQVNAFPLETTFQGVSIEVTQGDVTVNAIPIFVWDRQVSAIMPSGAPLGRVSVRLTFDGEQSNSRPITVVENSVGIFTATLAGIGPGIFQNFISQTEQPFNSPSNTARPGQIVIMWATGLGPISSPDGEAPPVGPLPFDVEIFVGGKTVTNLRYGGRTPCCSGVDQFVFDTPEDAPEGCYVPVQVRVGGVAVSNTVTMAIQKDGEPCSEPDNPFMQTFLGGGSSARSAWQEQCLSWTSTCSRPSLSRLIRPAAISVRKPAVNLPSIRSLRCLRLALARLTQGRAIYSRVLPYPSFLPSAWMPVTLR